MLFITASVQCKKGKTINVKVVITSQKEANVAFKEKIKLQKEKEIIFEIASMHMKK